MRAHHRCLKGSPRSDRWFPEPDRRNTVRSVAVAVEMAVKEEQFQVNRRIKMQRKAAEDAIKNKVGHGNMPEVITSLTHSLLLLLTFNPYIARLPSRRASSPTPLSR